MLSQKEIVDIHGRCHRQWEAGFYDSICDLDNRSLNGAWIEFDPAGEMSFHDPNTNRIVVGLSMIVSMWDVDTVEMLMNAVRLVRMHETGHLRFTATEPYNWGIRRAAELVIEYISKQEKLHVRFRKEADYDYVINELLPAKGIYLNMRLLMQTVANVFNAIEDGRIERILANAYLNFDPLRRYFRFKTWKKDLVGLKKSDMTNPNARLTLMFNEILSLATTQLNLNGFEAEFAGTDEESEIKKLMPLIYKGITAAETRTMVMEAGIPICEKLAPFIYDACRMSSSMKAPDWLKKLLSDMIKTAIESGEIGVSEEDAESDDSMFHPTFPLSDIEVTLDDETYDKLKEKLKDQGASENGIKIKREHPKEEESTSENDQEKSEPNQKGDGKKECGKSAENVEPNGGAEGSGEASTKNADEGNKAGSNGSAGSDSDADGNSSSGEGEEACGNESEGCGESKSDSHSSSGETTQSPVQQKSKTSVESLNKGAEDESAISSIEKEMEEAANKLNAEAAEALDGINQAARSEASGKMFKPVNTNSVPMTSGDVSDVCPVDFKEFYRKYSLTERLPVDLESRGKLQHKTYLEFIRNKIKPVSRRRKEGSIDPRNIYRLAMNKTDVFMKEGKTEEFDGCAYFLLDNSGSMHGRKRMAACRALAVQEMAFFGLFPFKIVAFDESYTIIHDVIKDWEEQQPLSCTWNFALHGRSGSGNSDEHDIRIATKELMARSERKKLLVVLSDGAPDDVADTKRAVDEARKKGITVVGIYFEEGEIDEQYCGFFCDMYQKDYVLCETKDIEKNLSKVLEKFFKS